MDDRTIEHSDQRDSLCSKRGNEYCCADRNCTGIVMQAEEIERYFDWEKTLPQSSPEQKKKFFEDWIKGWKYKLKLGNQVYLSTEDGPQSIDAGGYATIKPGDFVLLLTKEYLRLPKNVMAFISMQFDYKQKGLINVSGFHVDPGFHGKLIFAAFNAGSRDIVVREDEPMFMIFFEKLNGTDDKADHEGFDFIPANMIEQIRGKSATLASNSSRINNLEFYVKVMGAVIMVLLGIVLRNAFK